ncbi:hypothetical protein LCGC14_2653350 [marine sediment metagenome]|uniref:Uncharacterized protein n=1 Tax=marine sediment metagenome TaxID=412755 RepID=A0A0F8ZU92_9ZZZZ
MASPIVLRLVKYTPPYGGKLRMFKAWAFVRAERRPEGTAIILRDRHGMEYHRWASEEPDEIRDAVAKALRGKDKS